MTRRTLQHVLVFVLTCLFPSCSSDDPTDTLGVCGNGVVDTSETCDDGNLTSGDGCSATCTLEPGGGETSCANGSDDDDDGDVDCHDSDCSDRGCGAHGKVCIGTTCQCPSQQTTETMCRDGADDDCDGTLDCFDDDCEGVAECADVETRCSDGQDNDDDGRLDCADSDCAGQSCDDLGRECVGGDCDCPGGQALETLCDDGEDDDCDGSIDCADSDCDSAPSCAGRETVCDDNSDNDGDGQADCRDSDCVNRSCDSHGQRCSGGVCQCPSGNFETDCTDGDDNDCDGSVDCQDVDCAPNPACDPEPKSTHTWLTGPNDQDIYNYDVDLRVNLFPSNADPGWLYFWALQVNFSDGSSSHGGIQWASGGKKANWGGYGLVGGTQSNVIDYPWETGRWYRYRTWRLSQQTNGSWEWGFWLLDYATGTETPVGTVTSAASVIDTVVLFSETGYGVECESASAKVSWRSPAYASVTGGVGLVPSAGYATYNGTCFNPNNTNQRRVTSSPLVFFHQTNTTRTTPPDTYIFGP